MMLAPSPRTLLCLLLPLTLIGCGDCGSPPSSDTTPSPTDLGTDLDISPDVDASPDLGDMAPDSGEETDTIPPVIMISSAMTVDASGAYTLTGTAVDNVAVTDLSYSLDDGPPQPLSLSQDSFSAPLTLTAETTITIQALDAAGNQSSSSITVTPEAPALNADFTVEGMPWLHEPLIFDASSSSGVDDLSTLTFDWDFGDQQSAQGITLAHAYHSAETLTVTLTVTASDGRQDTASRDITIAAPMPQGMATLSGYVTDASGFAMPDVAVFHANDLSTPVATTDLRGRYEVSLGTGVPSVMHFKKQGWATQIQRISLPADAATGARDVSMRRAGAQVIVEDLDAPTEIAMNDGFRLNLPPQPFVHDDDGSPVTGQALISITPITPDSGEVSGFPGSFAALRQGFIPSTLATHGAVEVTLTQSGQPLQLAPGVEATLDIPLGTDADIGQIIDLWSLDPRNGYWIWEGTGEVITSPMNPNIKVLRAQVSHFSTWNADEPVDTRPVTLKISADDLAANVNDITVKSTSTSEQNAVVNNNTVTVSQELSQDPGAQSDVVIDIPTDYNSRIEIGSEEGCLYGSAELTPTSQEAEVSVRLVTPRSPLSNAFTLTPDQTEVIDFGLGGGGRESMVTFTEVPGQYWRLTARALRSGARGHVGLLAGCGGTSVARLDFEEGSTSSIVIEPGKDDIRTLIVRHAFGSGGDVELLLEPLDAPSTPSDTSLGERVEITWQDNSTYDQWVYLNAEQVAHIALDEDAPPAVNISIVTPSGDVRSPLNVSFTPNSKTFSATESGWHLLVINPQGSPTMPGSYDLVLGEILPELSLTFEPEQTEQSFAQTVRSLKTGDIQRFKIRKPGDHMLVVHPRFAQGSEATLAPRLGGALTTVLAPDNTTESYALAEQTSDFTLEFVLLTPELAPLAYHLDANMIPRDQPVVRIGNAPCLDTQTTSMILGAAALADGGTLEICGDSSFELFDGLTLRKQGLRFRGLVAAAAPPTLKAWPASTLVRIGQRNVAELSNLEIELTGDGIELELTSLDHEPYLFENLTLVGESTTLRPALKIEGRSSLDWSMASAPPRIANVHIDATALQGLRVETFDGLVVEDITVTGATERGIYASNVSNSTFSNLTLSDAVQAFEIAGFVSRQNTISGLTATHSTTPSINTSGLSSITVQDYPEAGVPSTLTIEDVHVTLGYDDQTALFLRNSGSTHTDFVLDSIFVDGQNLTDTLAIEVQPDTNGNTLTWTNSIVRDVTTGILEINAAQRFESITLAHNTFQLGASSTVARRDLVKLVNASATTFVQIVNTIFVGPAQATGLVIGVDFANATIDAPLGEIKHNLFHQIDHAYGRQNTVPFLTPERATDVNLDPMFINPMLQVDPMSPAVDAGFTTPFVILDYLGTMRPQGMAPDIGAYEQ